MKYKLAVVGKDIAYSQSPHIHSEFARAEKIDLEYFIEEVGSDLVFAEKIKALQQAGFQGCNITVPYKEIAFKLAGTHSPAAKNAAAANTFHFSLGHIYAENTDGVGFMRDLTQNIGFSPQGKRIVICGAGGAVRGILGPLLEAKPAKIILAHRTLEKVHILAQHFQGAYGSLIKAGDYSDLAQQTADLVIDGTTLKTNLLPFPDTFQLHSSALVYDLKYNLQADAPMMRWANSKQASFYDGIGMLVEQAAAAFKIWTGIFPATLPLILKLKAQFSK